MDAGTEVRTVNTTTGGEKGQKQVRLDLLPVPALWEVGRLYGIGAEKYTANNWRKGYEWSKSYSALQRHANLFWNGESIDADGFHHLAAVVFHALALMTFEVEHPELDDRFIPGRENPSA